MAHHVGETLSCNQVVQKHAAVQRHAYQYQYIGKSSRTAALQHKGNHGQLPVQHQHHGRQADNLHDVAEQPHQDA